MKTQLAKPARTRASYPEEYKQEALELWRNSGRSAAKVAAELGIRAPFLYRWAQLERAPKATASGPKTKRTFEELEADLTPAEMLPSIVQADLIALKAKALEECKKGRRKGEEKGSELTVDTRLVI